MTIHDDEKGKRIVTCFVSRDQNSMNYGHIMSGDVLHLIPALHVIYSPPVLLLFTIRGELKAPLTYYSASVQHHVKCSRPHVTFFGTSASPSCCLLMSGGECECAGISIPGDKHLLRLLLLSRVARLMEHEEVIIQTSVWSSSFTVRASFGYEMYSRWELAHDT
jgi:hypothetical protein